MSKRKKEVFTRIDINIYNKIKEKGYKISELIELGIKYKEEKDKILSEDYIKNLLKEFEKIKNDLKDSMHILIMLRSKLLEIMEYIESSKKRISSKFFPSKYDMIETLNNIEKKIDEIKRIISGE